MKTKGKEVMDKVTFEVIQVELNGYQKQEGIGERTDTNLIETKQMHSMYLTAVSAESYSIT